MKEANELSIPGLKPNLILLFFTRLKAGVRGRTDFTD